MNELSKLLEQQEWYVGGEHPRTRGHVVYQKLSGYPYLVETDFERYDAHEHSGLLRIEYVIMKTILGQKFADDWWQACCNYQEGRFKGLRKIDYFVFATRMSGESTTTFGNTVINRCLSDFISHSLHIDYYTLPAGDDGLTGCNTTDLESISMIYKAVGLKTKIKLVDWSDASFLSCRFVVDG